MSTETLYILLPEMVLAAAATLIYVGGVFVKARGAWAGLALAAILVSGYTLHGQYDQFFAPYEGAIEDAFQSSAPEVSIATPLAVDEFGHFVRGLVLVVGLALVLMAAQLAPDVQVPEYLGTLLLALTGIMLVGSARELVLLFVGLELISIPTYVLLYLGRRGIDSQEATAKYFYLSVLSSAVMLYGFSFLYGAAGSTDLTRVQAVLAGAAHGSGPWWFARLALVLIFAGLGFKVTMVPFHFYAPDVYQGTTAGNAALLSVLPKLGGLVALVRIVVVAMRVDAPAELVDEITTPGFETFAWQIALVLAILTMTLGNVVALWQDNVRRLLAYSAIAHGGYMLIGLAVACVAAPNLTVAAGFDGIAALLFYITVYALATTGAFAVLIYLGNDKKSIDNVDELAGAGRTHPVAAVTMAIFMFSLTGIPPLAGFWGKLNLLAGALSVRPRAADVTVVRNWFLALAVVGVVNAAISAAYYLRIVAVMYFRSPTSESRAARPVGAGAAMLLCALLVVIVGVAPNALQQGANVASQSVRHPPVVVAAETADRPATGKPTPAAAGEESLVGVSDLQTESVP